ncbi:hypothetical protein GPJ56_007345 [Histomonas meleagridis]|uniref:uncharacterized protein n=1 Tax=Histomonas meleagridis TaxID=135588 RepID=UPI00355A9AA7|nr:hypothetical protein GPJ56_007345 [Histomonas meleagridis]KAH0804191.1 hypothetical protein GO595_003021 [Histomonas meleagridis]
MSDQKYTIIYNGESLVIDPQEFAKNSLVFSQYYDPNSIKNGQMVIDASTPIESFKLFLPAVQGKKVDINEENLNDLRSLAEEWKAESLLEKIENFEQSLGEPKYALSKTIDCVAKNLSINQYLSILVKHINELINIDLFASLPPGILDKIFKQEECKIKDQHQFFKFICKVLISKGKKYSYLANFLNPNELSDEEIKQIFENEEIFDLYKVPDLMNGIAKMYSSKSTSERERHNQRKRQLDFSLKKISSEVQNLKNKMENINRQKKKNNSQRQNAGENQTKRISISIVMSENNDNKDDNQATNRNESNVSAAPKKEITIERVQKSTGNEGNGNQSKLKIQMKPKEIKVEKPTKKTG